jgi:ATP-binding cassette subfamily B protein
MTTENPALGNLLNDIPASWRSEIESRLDTGENVVTSVEVDLDARLHFVKGIMVLTNKRILARTPGETIWRDWPYRKGLHLKHHDHAGVGHLEVVDATGGRARWRF